MPETLVIRLGHAPSADTSWAVVDDAGTRIGDVASGPLAEAAEAQLQRRVIVLVPATQTVTARVNLPVRSTSKMLQVAPFALEEQIAGDVATLHFAVGRRDNDGNVDVTATDRQTMRQWMERLEQAGIVPQSVLSESAGVPHTEGGLTVMIDTDESCVRDAADNVFFVDHESLIETLELLIDPGLSADGELVMAVSDDGSGDDDGAEKLLPICVFFDDDSGAQGQTLINRLHERFPQIEFRRAPHGLLARMAAEVILSDAPNLRQGEFASSGRLKKHWLPWRMAAGLAAAFFVVTLAAKGAELYAYKTRYATLRTQIDEVYASVVPGDASSVPDPRGQFEMRLRDLGAPSGAPSDFLDGLQVLAAALPAGDSTTVESLDFNAGVMNLEVIAPDVPTLDTLREKVTAEPEWDARLTQTRPVDDAVKGRLQLQRTEP